MTIKRNTVFMVASALQTVDTKDHAASSSFSASSSSMSSPGSSPTGHGESERICDAEPMMKNSIYV